MISPYLRALLDTIAGTESPGYDVMYGGKRFNDFRDHPRVPVPIKSGPNRGRTSSAAGRYQFLAPTWDDQAKKLGLKDFGPQSQDMAAANLAREVFKQQTGGDLEAALASGDDRALAQVGQALSGTWTSLPGGIEQGQDGNRFVSSIRTALSKLNPIGSAMADEPTPWDNPDAFRPVGRMDSAPSEDLNPWDHPEAFRAVGREEPQAMPQQAPAAAEPSGYQVPDWIKQAGASAARGVMDIPNLIQRNNPDLQTMPPGGTLDLSGLPQPQTGGQKITDAAIRGAVSNAIPGFNAAGPLTGALGTGALAGSVTQAAQNMGLPEWASIGSGVLAGTGGAFAGRALSPSFGSTAGAEEAVSAALQGRVGAEAIPALQGVGDNIIPGYQPTTAEVLGRGYPGAAALQKSVAGNMGADDFATRQMQQDLALRGSVEGIAGTEAERIALEQARSQNWANTFGQVADNQVAITPELAALSGRPTVAAGYGNAAAGYADRGVPLPAMEDGSTLTADQLYRIKKGIDDQIAGQSSALNPTAAEVNRLQDARAARDAYLTEMEGLVPEAQTARMRWSEDSIPINQMDVGSAALDALTPRNLRAIDTDRVSPTGYGNWLANERKSIEQATGARLPPNATLDDIMTPEQAATLRGVEQNMADRSAINAVNAAPGSDTVKNLNERAWLARALPPSLGGQYLGAPFERAMRGTEDQRNQLLIQALLNPNGMLDMLQYEPRRASLWAKFFQSGLGAAAGAQ